MASGQQDFKRAGGMAPGLPIARPVRVTPAKLRKQVFLKGQYAGT
jgi:hypothetical protein